MPDAGKLARQIHPVGHDLEMQMRRPAAIDLVAPDKADQLARFDPLTGLHGFQGFARQMAIKRPEQRPARPRLMFDDHGGAIVIGGIVVDDTQHPAREGRIERRIGRDKDIDAQMLRPPFRAGMGLELVALVNVAIFAIKPDGVAGALSGKFSL